MTFRPSRHGARDSASRPATATTMAAAAIGDATDNNSPTYLHLRRPLARTVQRGTHRDDSHARTRNETSIGNHVAMANPRVRCEHCDPTLAAAILRRRVRDAEPLAERGQSRGGAVLRGKTPARRAPCCLALFLNPTARRVIGKMLTRGTIRLVFALDCASLIKCEMNLILTGKERRKINTEGAIKTNDPCSK